ncbi:MAG: hypothetical protein U0798_11000 [Gemmataceae bacterium]
MTPPIPLFDGHVNRYNFGKSSVPIPRIYFVNGIRVTNRSHARNATYLSMLIERPVWGVYNATWGLDTLGSTADFAQCLLDYTKIIMDKFGSTVSYPKPPKIPADKVDEFLSNVEKKNIVWNRATLQLFKQLVRHRHQEQKIIAHSQGNLITSNALFVLEDVLGSASLKNIRVYSLASPAPAWPMGLRHTHGGGGRQDNLFTNDLVALFRPHNLAKKIGIGSFKNSQGSIRTDHNAPPVSILPHDIGLNITATNFLSSIRKDLGISDKVTPEFVSKCEDKIDSFFPKEKT